MIKIKFVTAIYSDLSGTKLGGRPSRRDHYRYSLLSLLKMTNADFVCYTSDRELSSLIEFFFEKNQISEKQLEIKVFDLNQTQYTEILNKVSNSNYLMSSDRCPEIQFNKFFWPKVELENYDYVYWIDAGLSHCGIIPNKYLINLGKGYNGYFETDIFNNNFLQNLINFTDDKFFLIAKENIRNFWEGTVDPKYYKQYNSSLHVIGGLFGGKSKNWYKIIDEFEYYTNLVLPEQNKIFYEENIMSLIHYNNIELFNVKEFDVWWCPDSGPKDMDPTYYVINKSFYKVIEELI